MPHVIAGLVDSGPVQGRTPALALALLRLHLGLTMAFAAGLGKVSEFPASPWFVEQVAEIGFPVAAAFAFVAAWGEVVGGVLVALGLFTRIAAAQLCLQMGVAAFLYHGVVPLVDLHIAHVLFWTLGCVSVLGGGRFSLDALLERRRRIAGPTGAKRTAKALAMGIATILISGCLSPRSTERETPLPGPFVDLAGEWQGELEYADFSDDSRTVLPVQVSVVPREDGLAARLEVRVGEPSGRVERWRESHEIDRAQGRYEVDGLVAPLESYVWDSGREQGTVVWRGSEMESGRPVPVRGRVQWVADTLVFLKETRAPLQFRNALRLTRSR